MKGFNVQGSMFKVKEGARREATGESRKIVPNVPDVPIVPIVSVIPVA
jgi:hypothetical protein